MRKTNRRVLKAIRIVIALWRDALRELGGYRKEVRDD